MELPKNITQIGEADRNCKIYAEDYVISYIKQLNVPAQDKDMAVALYGIRKEENEISYIFLYGACKLDFLQRESRHLSQAQQQEIEKLRKKYFKEYQFMGYRLLNGEMVEGFHVCENGSCRYVQGYAQFYEKNDSMLAYMLDTRPEEAVPEEFNQEKYDMVKQRQAQRREKNEEKAVLTQPKAKNSNIVHKPQSIGRIRFAAVAVFAVLCVVGFAAMNGSLKLDELREEARQIFADMTEQKLPDTMEVLNPEVQINSIVTQDKLSDAVQQENKAGQQPADIQSPSDGRNTEQTQAPADAQNPDAGRETEQVQTPADIQGSTVNQGTETTPPSSDSQNPTANQGAESQQPSDTQPSSDGENLSAGVTEGETKEPSTPPSQEPEGSVAETSGPVAYVIQKGDTLIAISIRQYGSEKKVSEICELNKIDDPDAIQVGQKILLP